MSAVIQSFAYFTGLDGEALDNARIYIGEAGQDARQYPIAVYRDAAMTLPWTQPIRTVAGYPAYQGAPSQIHIPNPECSMTVLANDGSVVVNNASGFVIQPGNDIGIMSVPVTDLGTADDGAVINAAYASAISGGYRALYIPEGEWTIVTGLVFNEDGPDIIMAGPSKTVLNAGADNMAVVRINRSPSTNRLRSAYFGGFTIDVSGRAGCKGLYTYRLISSVLDRISIIGNEHPTFVDLNYGLYSEGDQYSTWRDIKIERVWCGHYMLDGGAGVGGGINNNFTNFHVANCKLNAAHINVSGLFPMGQNTFTNFWCQSSTHCNLYLNNVYGHTYTEFPPEACSGTGTMAFNGYTIKAGHIHAENNVQARFDGYGHVSNDPEMMVRAENQSRLVFVNSNGAMVRTYADDTSSIDWDGTWGNGSIFLNTQVRPHHIETSRSLVATQDANIVVDGSFPTVADRESPVAGYVSNTWGLAAGPTVNGDSGLVAYTSVTFGAGVGGAASNAVRVAMTAGSTLDRTKLCAAAILVRSSVDADYLVTFSTMAVSGTVSLKAGEWTRVVMANGLFTGTAFGYFDLWPVAAGGPTLDFCYPTLAQDLSAHNFGRFVKEHVFNPRDPKGAIHSATAAPVAGTWQRGAIVWNSAPAAGGVPGWECVTAGTPGTWKAMAALAV